MEHKGSHTKSSGIWRWLLIPFIVLLILAGFRWSLKSDWLLDKVRLRLEQEAGTRISGRLVIDNLEGDLLFGVRFSGIELVMPESDFEINVDSVRVSYTVLDLIREPYDVRDISIYGLRSELIQYEDGSWNYESVIEELANSADSSESDTPSWQVRNLELRGGDFSVHSPSLPDESVDIRSLEFIATNTGYSDEQWAGTLQRLNFQLDEDRFSQSVEIGASGSLSDGTVTLDQLLLNTGRTLFESRAQWNETGQFAGYADLQPLSWLDVSAYSNQVPIEQNLDVSISFSGTYPDLTISVDASAAGLESLNAEADLSLADSLVFRRVVVAINEFNGPLLTGDTLSPSASSFTFEGDGEFSVTSPGQSTFNSRIGGTGIQFSDYRIETFSSDLNLSPAESNLTANVSYRGQDIQLSMTSENVFDEEPEWVGTMDAQDVDLAVLMNDPQWEGIFSVSVDFRGQGFSLSDDPVYVQATLNEGRWHDQVISQASFDGLVSENQVEGQANADLNGSRISGEFTIRDWQTEPLYEFSSSLSDVNMANFSGFERFPTRINMSVEGSGRGFDPANMELMSAVRLDSSLVFQEEIERFHATVGIRDHRVHVTDTELLSSIADGSISLNHHLTDFYDEENRVDLDVEIKDITSFAQVLEVDSVRAQGLVSGYLRRQEEGRLQFDADVDLTEVLYDSLLSVETVSGNISGVIDEGVEGALDLHLERFITYQFALQSVRMQSQGMWRDSLLTGDINMEIERDQENYIRHAGNFRYENGHLYVLTNELDLTTPLRTLSLMDPFELNWQDEVVRMSPMRIQSGPDSAFLLLDIPYLSEDRQEINLEAELLNLGAIQGVFFEEAYVEALLSGNLQIVRDGTSIMSETELFITDIRYNNGIVDSLRIHASVQEGRLIANSSGWYDQEELFSFSGSVPFEPVAPLSLGEEFFEQPVDAEFNLNRTSTTYWASFLEEATGEDMSAFVQFDGVVSGTAGEPRFTGGLKIEEGTISGVPVDSVIVDIEYGHEEGEVMFDGFIESLGTRVAEFDALLPLYVDLRRFRVDLPDETDEVQAYLSTDSFNLALLNNFLNRETFRNLRGTLTGNVEFSGSIASLEQSGSMSLSGGNLGVVPAGIVLTDINSTVGFQSNQVQLQSFVMRSGAGQFSASGSLDMDGFQPGNMDIQFQANQFRASNTNDLNAILDLEGVLSGTLERPSMQGSVRFRSGYFYLRNFGDEAVEDIQLEDDEEAFNFTFYDSLALDMEVEFSRQFFVRNRQYLDMEVELGGVVDLQKQSGQDLQMFGSVSGISGYARPLGRNFTLEDAVVTFYGPVDNPELNIRTLYKPPQPDAEISIWYVIEGTVQDPEFRFESDPFLELQDIISYTLFGQPFYALESWKQVVASSGSNTTAADVALEVLLDRVEMLATQQLGIDVVQIDNSRSGSGSTTSVKTGWYLNERTFFAISNQISATPKTLFILEWMLRENLELIITQGDDNREGIDLRWSFDY